MEIIKEIKIPEECMVCSFHETRAYSVFNGLKCLLYEKEIPVIPFGRDIAIPKPDFCVFKKIIISGER